VSDEQEREMSREQMSEEREMSEEQETADGRGRVEECVTVEEVVGWAVQKRIEEIEDDMADESAEQVAGHIEIDICRARVQ
jgi:hypothetical protein